MPEESSLAWNASDAWLWAAVPTGLAPVGSSDALLLRDPGSNWGVWGLCSTWRLCNRKCSDRWWLVAGRRSVGVLTGDEDAEPARLEV